MASGTVVYVGSAGTSEIHVFRLGESGDLEPLAVVPLPDVAEPGPSTPLAVSPDRRFLYCGVRSQPFQVAAFAIDGASGALTRLGNAPLADSMAYIATDTTGRWLFGASYGGSRVAVNPIGPDGRVGAPQQVIPTEPKAHAIIPDPSNAFVYSTSLGGDLVHRFAFDAATGQLEGGEPAARVAAGAGPRHLRFHPSGRFLFLFNELNASLDVLAVEGPDAPLRSLQTVSALPPGFSGKPWGADLQVTPDGRLLYASERTSSTLLAYQVDPASGRLTPLGHTPTETQPRGFAIDPSGRVLVAAGEVSHHVSSYRIEPGSGTLTPVTRLAAGQGPNWVEIVRLS
jgi:6-phosphogluconolactonase